MPEFVLIDSGDADFLTLPPFVQGYIEAMFFVSECMGVSSEEFMTTEFQEEIVQGSSSGTIPGDVGFHDISADSLERIMLDCQHFLEEAGGLLTIALERGYEIEQGGRDFWFTRNGHGAGFWDRAPLDEGDLGITLSERAREYGEIDVWFDGELVHHD